jgi:hypothetical protein
MVKKKTQGKSSVRFVRSVAVEHGLVGDLGEEWDYNITREIYSNGSVRYRVTIEDTSGAFSGGSVPFPTLQAARGNLSGVLAMVIDWSDV